MAVALSPMGLRAVQAANPSNGQMKMTILGSALALTSPQALNFGAVLAGGVVGTVKIDTAGVRTWTAVTPLATPLPSEAIMKAFGNSGLSIDVSVTKTAFTVANTTAATMVVDQFNINTNAGGTKQTLFLTGTTRLIPIGATLHVGSPQAVGTYKGTFTVTVAY